MAPSTFHSLQARDCYNDGTCYYSTWDNWGRWIALVLIILFFLFLITGFTSRRRRRRGLAPMYGTGWMGGKPPTGAQQHGQWASQQPGFGAHGAGGQGGWQAPPPPYMGTQATGTTFNAEHGYYGQQQSGNVGGNGGTNVYGGNGQSGGIELQPPGASYHPGGGSGLRGDAGGDGYAPPAGPPPGKDGVIR